MVQGAPLELVADLGIILGTICVILVLQTCKNYGVMKVSIQISKKNMGG
jgi:hypothetical protein